MTGQFEQYLAKPYCVPLRPYRSACTLGCVVQPQ